MHTRAKYSFHDDYSEGAHPRIIEALALTNMSQQCGYGSDEYSEEARNAIRNLIGTDEAMMYFTPGGTGANLISVASHLRPHEAIIAVEAGHIVGKEGDAIEVTGHKIITEPGLNGKLTPEMIQSAFDQSSAFDYQPKPKMVFTSNATEIGTLYNRGELTAVAAICKKLDLLLLLNGARLGAVLTSSKNDMTLADIFNLTDIFWIGGTKNGALLGEAVVIKHPSFGADFPYHMKQRGGLLAKGRVTGIQFSTLFADDLFFRLARYSNVSAAELSTSLLNMGFRMWAETETNQVFPIFSPALVEELQKHFDFFVWEHLHDESLVVRLVTSWATEISEVRRFRRMVEESTKVPKAEIDQ
ncbi:MAG: hypothetical protein Q9226_005557 [Calogaya cf. arnoldii]